MWHEIYELAMQMLEDSRKDTVLIARVFVKEAVTLHNGVDWHWRDIETIY